MSINTYNSNQQRIAFFFMTDTVQQENVSTSNISIKATGALFPAKTSTKIYENCFMQFMKS